MVPPGGGGLPATSVYSNETARLDSSAVIRSFLDGVAGRLRRRAATRAALYGFGGLMILALAAPLLCAAMEPRPDSSPLGWTLAAALLGIGVAVLTGALLPARRWRDRHRVASYVGARMPPVESDLLSVV